MKIGLPIIWLLCFYPVISAIPVCESCSHSGCPHPIYHCPLGAHCARNCSIPIATEETEIVRIKEKEYFNVELPIKPGNGKWRLKQAPPKDFIEILYQGPAINDPTLFIFNFRAKKAGTTELILQKLEAETVAREKSIAVEVKAD